MRYVYFGEPGHDESCEHHLYLHISTKLESFLRGWHLAVMWASQVEMMARGVGGQGLVNCRTQHTHHELEVATCFCHQVRFPSASAIVLHNSLIITSLDLSNINTFGVQHVRTNQSQLFIIALIVEITIEPLIDEVSYHV